MGFLEKIFGVSAAGITAEELGGKLKYGKHPLVLDVRQPDEFRQGHIAGAKLIPLNELARRMAEIPKGREVVCVCASGNRSRSAANTLARAGYTVFNLQGGMLSWRRAKLPMQK
jgi:rhodanese-related sulfurtransferase